MLFPLPCVQWRLRVSTLFDRTAGTNIGNMTNGGGLAAAFDNNTAQPSTTACQATGTTGYVGKQLVTAYPVASMTCYPGDGTAGIRWSVNGGNTATLAIYGKNTAPASYTDGTLLGTTSFADSFTTSKTVTSTDQTTDYLYVWAALSGGGTFQGVMSEVQFNLMQ